MLIIKLDSQSSVKWVVAGAGHLSVSVCSSRIYGWWLILPNLKSYKYLLEILVCKTDNYDQKIDSK